MKFTTSLLLAAGLVAASVSSAHAKIERVVEKSFTVQPGGVLQVNTQGGEIRVSPSGDNVVKVTARERIRASSDAEADDLLKKLDLTIEQNGNEITASAKYEQQPLGFHFGSWPPVNVDFTVTVPASFATNLRTSGGGITVGDLAGKVNARTSGGGIRLGKLGAEVDAHTSGGSVTLDGARGPVKLSTSGGNITAGTVAGEAELSTSGGSIKIESVEGALKASTSGGSIRAAFAGPLKSNCSLSTSGGSVKVTLDKATAFRLDASTSGGSVDAEGLTITLEKSTRSRTQLVGAVNGGGSLLKLRTSGGDIVVQTR
ncbi:MAG: DUF4097 family beta strand repeat-containing protein [Verrucomicrobia bacterium]|nr:DUF4097 family beta strand repeat-containing protein [Verrucomicrobiota bacterium]